MEMNMPATSPVPFLAHLRFLGTLMLGAYLLINALLLGLTPLTSGWPIWSVTALAVPPMVLGMVYLVMPLARRALAPPLRQRGASGDEARS
jgi:antibiotic biosynthesis monooxygenase (ABM) superfamily enzyme